jgi:hypothetical protein
MGIIMPIGETDEIAERRIESESFCTFFLAYFLSLQNQSNGYKTGKVTACR